LLLAAVHAFKHAFDPNGAAALFTLKRLRIGQAHEAAATRAWHKLIGADRGNAHGFCLTTGAQAGA
jgi:hypothetical protein